MSLRSRLIRLASTMPKGQDRTALVHLLARRKTAGWDGSDLLKDLVRATGANRFSSWGNFDKNDGPENDRYLTITLTAPTGGWDMDQAKKLVPKARRVAESYVKGRNQRGVPGRTNYIVLDEVRAHHPRGYTEPVVQVHLERVWV